MLRLAVIVAFTVSLFVERVCPIPQQEVHNTKTIATAINATMNVPDIRINNSTEEPRTPVKLANNERVETVENTKPTIMEGHRREKHLCNSTKEQFDMLNCDVSPTDDDDDDDSADNTPRSNTTVKSREESTTSGTTVQNEALESNTGTRPPQFVPFVSDADKNVKPTTEATTAKLNKSFYVTVPSTIDHPTSVNVSQESKHGVDHSKGLISSMEKGVNNIQTMVSQSVNEAEKSTHENGKSMPSGIIALVTAVTFVIAAVIAYISMIACRRYLEYRYGHRELLVNELEFDTNDLRHFEL